MTTAPILTDAGKELLSRSVGGEKITFTRFVIGNGDQQGESSEMTAIVNPILYFPISSCDKTTAGYVKINGRFTSNDITTDFRWKELGVLCKGEDGVETLYAYSNDGENGTWLKAKGADVVAENAVSIIIAIGDAENVTAITVDSAVYATKTEVDAHISSRTNPHDVTAAQVGLGNVPNVATNDQTPTYTTAETAEAPASGEKLSVAFGKLRRAVLDLLAHIGNKGNPHGVTAEQIKAAPKIHTHSTADITSGILGVARGGTGVSGLNTLAQSISDLHVVTGTYIGTGTYGSSNKTSLTFARTPKMLLVQPTENGNQKYAGFIVQQGVKQNTNGGVVDDVLIGSLYFEWNESTVAWYSNYISSGTTAGFQCNLKDTEYRYIAIL